MMPVSRTRRANSTSIWPILSSKIARVLCAAVLVFVVVVIWLSKVPLFLGHDASITPVFQDGSTNPNGRLHLLIPATSTNVDLCKLLLSAQILGYPTPTLINYGDLEDADEYVQHLAKVQGILNYLETVKTADGEDLVLIIDGYDVWFQLRPDVLLKRYFALNAAADARAIQAFGSDTVSQHDIRQTIVLGPDKVCWPSDWARPACWAVPVGTLPRYAFGPDTNRNGNEELNMPQWLNSGTILGPIGDLKELLKATLEAIHANHTTDSDQFYFSNIFGEQEYARLGRKPELLNATKQYIKEGFTDEELLEPEITDKKVEFHIGIDYGSSMFQTLAFSKQELTWTRAKDSWKAPNGNTYGLQLPHDIANSSPPFHALENHTSANDYSSWAEVEFHYNAITQQAPVLIHFTGEKRFRDVWWSKLWFQSRSEQLHDAIHHVDQRSISLDPINGIHWFAAEPEDADEIGKTGAYTDRRGWLSWKRLCGASQEEIFRVPDDRFFHAAIEAEFRVQEQAAKEAEAAAANVSTASSIEAPITDSSA